MATFGNDTGAYVSGNVVTGYVQGHFDNTFMAQWDQPIPACTINKIWAYVGGAGGNSTLQFGIYDASYDTPDEFRLVGTTDTLSVLDAADVEWRSVDCSIDLSAGTYCLAFRVASGGSPRLGSTSKDSGKEWMFAGTFPDPLGSGLQATTMNWSMYAEYTEPTIPPTPGTFYTAGIHQYSKVVGLSGNDSSFARRRLTDQNHDTFWSGSSVNDQDIVMDLKAYTSTLGSIDAFGIFIRNHSGSSGGNLTLEESDSPTSGFTDLGVECTLNADKPISIGDLSSNTTKRYIKFVLNDMSVLAKVAQVYALKRYILAPHNHEPRGSKTTTAWDNITAPVGTAREIVTPNYTNKILKFTRLYNLSNQDQIDDCNDIFHQVQGQRQLFVYNDKVDSYLNVCRMIKNKPKWKDADGAVRTLTMEFKSVPYEED